MTTPPEGVLRVAAAQIAPVLLDRDATVARIVAAIDEAAAAGCGLVAFGEALLPGYPVWLDRVDAARFDAPDLKRLHACSVASAVEVAAGHLDPIRDAAQRGGIAVALGMIERDAARGGSSLFCSAAFIDARGAIASVHRKLVPTYEERLAWTPGDGAGLVVHRVGAFTVGVLNCWENWMPLARAALHAQGEDLHVALWPGRVRLTRDVTRFAAFEGRSYVLAAGGLLAAGDVPAEVPLRERFVRSDAERLLDGGSAIAGPDGAWIAEPRADTAGLVIADLDPRRIAEERQNLDVSGHYARPEILRLEVDRRRAAAARFRDAAD